ncbi:hypothetical protein DFJ73DRAFT_960107 [Zopfochytrium polystomum]|nr:hypothetical protein DFJ73DRAFT_960107 [Zopfochytrium polystomum]
MHCAISHPAEQAIAFGLRAIPRSRVRPPLQHQRHCAAPLSSLSHGSTTPPLPARDWLLQSSGSDRFARVPHRGVIEIEGADTVKFLQGMVTNQVAKIERGGDGMLAGFLNAQGRVLFDAFIYPKNRGGAFPHPVFLIDCDDRAVEPLMKHLKRYILRSKVSLRDVSSEVVLTQAWGPNAASLWGNYVEPGAARKQPAGGVVPKGSFVDVGCRDPRMSDMGVRFVVPADAKVPLPATFTEASPEEYTLRRILLGIPEGVDDVASAQALPMESNFDLMSGVDFRKGCYLGQELTIRTYHTGVTRKRIVPVQLFDKDESPSTELLLDTTKQLNGSPEPGSEIRLGGVAGRKGEVGRLGSVMHNVGLALMRLDQCFGQKSEGDAVDAAAGLHSLVVGEGKSVRAFIPEWWPRPVPLS